MHPSHRPVTQELVHPKQVAGWYLAGQTKRWLTTRSGQKSRHYLLGKKEMVSRKKKKKLVVCAANLDPLSEINT